MITALCCLALGALAGYGWRRVEARDHTEAHWSDVRAVVDDCHPDYHDLGVHAPEWEPFIASPMASGTERDLEDL